MKDVGEEVAAGLYQQLERRFGSTFWDEFSMPEVFESCYAPGLIIQSQTDEMMRSFHALEIGKNRPDCEALIVKGEEHLGPTKPDEIRNLFACYLDCIFENTGKTGEAPAKEAIT